MLELAGYRVSKTKIKKSIQLPLETLLQGQIFLKNLSASAREWYAFAPGSTEREKHKRWPEQNYGRLSTMLLRDNPNLNIIVIGSTSEIGVLSSVKEHGKYSNRIHVVTPDDIGLTMAIFASCLCVVTGCNGPSHLAGLVGTPLISIYGPTNPGNTGAWSEKRRVLSAKLPCSPCYRLGFLSGCETPICMKLVTPEMAYCAIRDLISAGGCDPLPWLKDNGSTKPFNFDCVQGGIENSK